jgi:hypothetical protein
MEIEPPLRGAAVVVGPPPALVELGAGVEVSPSLSSPQPAATTPKTAMTATSHCQNDLRLMVPPGIVFG